MSRRTDIAFSLAFVGVVAIVVRGAASAPKPKPLRTPTADERAQLARQVAMQEAGWKASAAADFPTDAWSQRDAFHNHEMNLVRELANGKQIPAEEVFRGIDEDIHANKSGEDRSAEVVPLKPRTIFD